MLVVADASPLIFLGRLDLLHLLQSVYGRVLVPTAVRDEVLGDGPELPGASAVRAATWLEIVDEEPIDAVAALLRGSLGAGERAAIALAVGRRAHLVLIDDRPARLAAERLGLAVQGTVGTLVQARRMGLIPELAPVLARLVDFGARLSPALLAAALGAVGEEPQP